MIQIPYSTIKSFSTYSVVKVNRLCVKPRLHDTTGRQTDLTTGLSTGLTTGCIV